jgi:hypothetical protein
MPRHLYWTIIAGGVPTAFRSRERDDLLPTLKQLQRQHPDAMLMWFERGRLWESPQQARAQYDAEREQARRPPGWRPGGEHRDPREKYKKKPRDVRRREQMDRWRQEGAAQRPKAERDRDWGDRRPPGPAGNRVPRAESHRPDRPFRRPAQRPDRPPQPAGQQWERPPHPERQRQDRPPRPTGKFSDRGTKDGTPRNDRSSGFRPKDERPQDTVPRHDDKKSPWTKTGAISQGPGRPSRSYDERKSLGKNRDFSGTKPKNGDRDGWKAGPPRPKGVGAGSRGPRGPGRRGGR